MSRLVLLRHGSSLGNVGNRVTGKLDLPLAPKGIEEANKVAALLSCFSFQRVYSSTMQRATQTTDIIFNQLGISPPTLRTSLLDSRNLGSLEGSTLQEVEAQYGPQALRNFKRGVRVEHTPPNGEDFEQVAGRVWSFYRQFIYQDMLRDYDSLVVAHGNVITAMIMQLDGLGEEEVLVKRHHISGHSLAWPRTLLWAFCI